MPWHGGKEILLATLAELGLPRRLQNALRVRNCSLVGQLIQISEDELLRIPAMGVKTIIDAQRILARYSLDLGTPLPNWNQAAAIEARRHQGPRLASQLTFEQEADPEKSSDILLATLGEAGLPQRFINRLPSHGCELVGQVVQWTEAQLYSLESLGTGSVSEARSLLLKHGLKFGMELPNWDDTVAFAQRECLLERRRAKGPTVAVPAVSPNVSDKILLATLDELGLPKRFVNQLPLNGCRLVGQLIQKTEAELFRLPNLGRKSVYEARNILASYGLSFGLKVPGWNDQEAMVRREASGNQIRRAIFDLQGESLDAYDLLEDEARQVLGSLEKLERNVDMLSSLLGFDGRPPKTLETVGRVYNLTRERVRQISDRAQRRFRVTWCPTPRLDDVLQLLEELEPTSAARFTETLIRRGYARTQIHPQAVIEFAEFAAKKTDVGRVLLGAEEIYSSAPSERLIRQCASELRRATSAMGCTSLDRLAIVVGVPLDETDRIRAILEILSETIWLGPEKMWAMSSRPTRNRVANMAEKIFVVTESITLPELRRCLSRSYRLATVPTADALVALLELKGIATSDGDSMHRLRLFSTDCLGSVELPFFLAFKEHGSPLSRERLEDICVDQYGVHPTSFWIYLSYSPVVIKLAPGVYALAGADVTPGAVEDVRLRTKTAQTPSEHGWTQKGELWCVTQLDRNNVRSGNRFIPAYVARLTNGDWACSVAGELAAGVVTVEQGLARGVALAFSLAGAENGDLARFTFDLQRRSVEVRVGGSELNEDAAVGPDYFEEAEDETELDLDDDPPATSN